MEKKIFVITGEVSGDILASKIFKYIDLKKIIVKGIAGSNLKKIGINGPFESKDITFFGITDVLRNIFYIRKKIDETVQYIETFRPDIVFSVDSPDFVFQVIKKLRKRKKIRTKFFHFVAPTIWAWREGRGKKIKKLLDKVYLLFKFEEKYFDKYNVCNQFVGHPFFEEFKIRNYKTSNDNKLISFCPGSREKEINTFMPIYLEIIKNYSDRFNYHFAITKGTESLVRKYLKNFNHLKFFVNYDDNLKKEYLKKSLITISKSGTMSLDLCREQVPFLTIYKLSWINFLLIKPFVKVKYINIINIIADKEIIPEFIQSNCNSNKIISKLEDLINNQEKLRDMVEEYNLILSGFSNKDTSKQIADDLTQNLT